MKSPTRSMSPARLVILVFALGVLGCAHTAGTRSDPGATTGLGGTNWQVESIGDTPVLDRTRTALRFENDGSVSGSTGCNTFAGKATLEGAAVRFGPMAMTRMACAPEANDQELRFTRALDQVTGWRAGAGGALELTGADGAPLMRLSRAPK